MSTEPAQRTAEEKAERANRIREGLLVLGICAIVLGSVIAAVSWPGTEPDPNNLSGDVATVPTGSETVRNIALIVVGLGQFPLFVALVSYGVSLGIRASRV